MVFRETDETGTTVEITPVTKKITTPTSTTTYTRSPTGTGYIATTVNKETGETNTVEPSSPQTITKIIESKPEETRPIDLSPRQEHQFERQGYNEPRTITYYNAYQNYDNSINATRSNIEYIESLPEDTMITFENGDPVTRDEALTILRDQEGSLIRQKTTIETYEHNGYTIYYNPKTGGYEFSKQTQVKRSLVVLVIFLTLIIGVQ